MLLTTLSTFVAAQLAFAADVPPTGRPLGVLLGQSTLAFTGWPAFHGTDGSCGKASGFWQINNVMKGDKSLKDRVVPVYAGSVPLSHDARSTVMFLKGPLDCLELVEQKEIGAETIVRAAATPNDCELQLRAVNQVLRTLATNCEADTDCAAYALHPNSCERPRTYAARVKTSLPEFWAPLAARARQACAVQWSKQAACAPVAMTAHCYEHQCVEGPAPAAMAPFARATLQESCAPHDAASMSITVRPKGADFPMIGLNWWGEGRPRRGGPAGIFSLDGEASYSRGFTASYCPFNGGCQLLRSIKMRLKLGADGKGELDFDAETLKGEKLHATVPAELGPEQRVICG